MGIVSNFKPEAIEYVLSLIPNIVSEEIIRALSYLGEKCIGKIRDRSGEESWFDITGNLRSSIGYAVYDHGRIAIESAFNQVKKGSLGVQEGRKYIEDLASKYSQTYALVVVAGMSYAEYVEAKDNKDVLASTELWARSEIDRYLSQAVQRAERRITLELQKFA